MANETKRKVVLVIVEGEFDKIALELILSKALAQPDTKIDVHCVNGSITSREGVRQNDVAKEVQAVVKAYAQKEHLQGKDFLQVIQITDTDGAYIPLTAVVGPVKVNPDPFYTLNEIQTAHPSRMKKTNERKKANLDRIVNMMNHVTFQRVKIPYRLYYISCNMDHAFHNQNNLNDAEKKVLARQFRSRYGEDVPGFYTLLQSLLPPWPYNQDYKTSWEYIRQGLHSLERYSNLYLILPASAPSGGGTNAPKNAGDVAD